MRMWPQQLQRVERYYPKIQDIFDRTAKPVENPQVLESWDDEFLAFFCIATISTIGWPKTINTNNVTLIQPAEGRDRALILIVL